MGRTIEEISTGYARRKEAERGIWYRYLWYLAKYHDPLSGDNHRRAKRKNKKGKMPDTSVQARAEHNKVCAPTPEMPA